MAYPESAKERPRAISILEPSHKNHSLLTDGGPEPHPFTLLRNNSPVSIQGGGPRTDFTAIKWPTSLQILNSSTRTPCQMSVCRKPELQGFELTIDMFAFFRKLAAKICSRLFLSDTAVGTNPL